MVSLLEQGNNSSRGSRGHANYKFPIGPSLASWQCLARPACGMSLPLSEVSCSRSRSGMPRKCLSSLLPVSALNLRFQCLLTVFASSICFQSLLSVLPTPTQPSVLPIPA
eukprot:365975-Chlamydomonas_euryale.AAC.11